MKTPTYSTHLAEQSIIRQITKLVELIARGQMLQNNLLKKKEHLELHDRNNEKFAMIIEDVQESFKMTMRAILLILSFIIDFALLFDALSLLDSTISPIARVVIPLGLVFVEVIISYFTILQKSEDDNQSKLLAVLPYFVLFILVGLSISSIVYSVQNYNEQIDGMAFSWFLLSVVVKQGVLLIGSLLLHIFLIRHSAKITEAGAFFRYRKFRKSIVKDIDRFEAMIQNNVTPEMKMRVQAFAQEVEMFKRKYPHSNIQFEKMMSEELINMINIIMGKKIFCNTTGEIPIIK